MANFILPANGMSQGNYFLAIIPKMAVFDSKMGLLKLRRQPNLQTFFEMVSIFEFKRDEAKNFRKQFWGLAHKTRIIANLPKTNFSPFYFSSPEIIEVKFRYR